MSGYIISRIKRIKLVFDVRDIWPDIALEMGEIKKESFLYNIMDKLANFIYKKSYYITCVSQGKYTKLIQKGIPKEKVKLVSNGFDSEFLENDIDEEIIDKYKLKEGNILIYTGVVGIAQGLDLIVDAADSLKEYKDIRFLIVGDGFEREILEKKARDKGLTNIIFTGMVPNNKVFTFYKFAMASIVPLKNENLKDSVPTKMLESLGASCPVILCAKGEAEELLIKSKGGIAINPGDYSALRNAILELCNNEELRKTMSYMGRDFVLNNFTREKIADELQNILKSEY
jgi:glycosyltransferase involved in cell wall biosynthesis